MGRNLFISEKLWYTRVCVYKHTYLLITVTHGSCPSCDLPKEQAAMPPVYRWLTGCVLNPGHCLIASPDTHQSHGGRTP